MSASITRRSQCMKTKIHNCFVSKGDHTVTIRGCRHLLMRWLPWQFKPAELRLCCDKVLRDAFLSSIVVSLHVVHGLFHVREIGYKNIPFPDGLVYFRPTWFIFATIMNFCDRADGHLLWFKIVWQRKRYQGNANIHGCHCRSRGGDSRSVARQIF